MSEVASHEVTLLGERVNYDLKQSDEATEPRIEVDIHGVTVILPPKSSADPEILLHENAAWVVEKKRKFDTYREDIPQRKFEPGESFPYLGNPHEVIIERRSSSVVGDNTLRLAKHHVQETSVKRALETLYRRKARERFESQANRYASEMGVEYEKIEVRNQRTKWGSCSTTGTLGLNWRLMMAPPEICDYVIIHELAHLSEPNHTDAFWSLVAKYDPEYESHSRWLENHGAELIFSDDDI
ncbi:DUF45 domain-containing protein [Halovenus sp. WSH3]|uniref:DUF45 domain-containing protein n=1 Tax=Halovenus carboxidivorans TaxID=2692199 RepID=A0A6B0T520_9EURY|nr:SprT family zinc-dependent metalloprotease [Halovenus carboxidivorans]MXR52057.1 DUF45 domain-containing protein [Halovenus carboxidivorans]